jgi:hypothetical protein
VARPAHRAWVRKELGETRGIIFVELVREQPRKFTAEGRREELDPSDESREFGGSEFGYRTPPDGVQPVSGRCGIRTQVIAQVSSTLSWGDAGNLRSKTRGRNEILRRSLETRCGGRGISGANEGVLEGGRNGEAVE